MHFGSDYQRESRSFFTLIMLSFVRPRSGNISLRYKSKISFHLGANSVRAPILLHLRFKRVQSAVGAQFYAYVTFLRLACAFRVFSPQRDARFNYTASCTRNIQESFSLTLSVLAPISLANLCRIFLPFFFVWDYNMNEARTREETEEFRGETDASAKGSKVHGLAAVNEDGLPWSNTRQRVVLAASPGGRANL